MLSAKGRVCNNKVVILDKLQTLRNRLQGYIDEGAQKVQKRETDASNAKSAWLDAEGQYLLAKKTAEDADATVANDLKKVSSLSSLLELNKARLSKLRASTTEQLSEIDDEEAIIRELLGYISDLHSSTVDVVRAPSLRARGRCAPAFSLLILTSIPHGGTGRTSRLCPRSSARESTSSCSGPLCATRPPPFRPSHSERPPHAHPPTSPGPAILPFRASPLCGTPTAAAPAPLCTPTAAAPAPLRSPTAAAPWTPVADSTVAGPTRQYARMGTVRGSVAEPRT
jgi:hypothetical protein